MKQLFNLALLFFMSSTMFAQGSFEFAGDISSHQQFTDGVAFRLSNALLRVYVVGKDVLRFRYTSKAEFSPVPSYAVLPAQDSVQAFQFTTEAEHFVLKTDVLTVRIQKNPCRVAIYDSEMTLINADDPGFGVCFDHDEVRCCKKLFADEKFYGLGEKTGALCRRGNQYTMWNSDRPGYTLTEDPLYVSIPFFIGIREHKAYGIFFDNTCRSYFNMGASNRRFYWFGAEQGELDYYFFYGPGIARVISAYTALTGRMELPPLWALGYQQSKWSYYPETTVRTLAKNFRDKNIPCDVLYLDIHYMDGYRVFTWDKERFPHPEGLLQDLRQQGFHVVPIIDPGVKVDDNYFAAREGLEKKLFAVYPDGEVYQGEVWPSWAYFPDFTKPETRDWWGEKLSALLKQGVAGFWNDMNEPAVWGQAFPDFVQFWDHGFTGTHKKIHNVYGFLMAKATFDGLKKFCPEQRPFILTRAGFAGVQRYAAVWTGDNVASSDHLKLACVMCQGMGLSGLSFVGADVGGFIGNPSQRLFTRWMQLGAFTPFFRGHSAIGQPDREPWAFGEEVERWVRQTISLRYRFLPYLYDTFYRASQSGLPVLRPMLMNFQDDDECYAWDAQFQFMLGDSLLVAPVLSEHDNFKKLYLPRGKWLDFWSDKVYDGGQWIIVEAPIDKIPLFVRAGGILPLQDVVQFADEKKQTSLEIRIFPSDAATYTFYEDDGVSQNYRKGIYALTDFSVRRNEQALEMTVTKSQQAYQHGRTHYLFRIWNNFAPSEVKRNGAVLRNLGSEDELIQANQGWYWHRDHNMLILKSPDVERLELHVQK